MSKTPRISDSQEYAYNFAEDFVSRLKLCKYLTFPAASCNVVCGWPKCIALQTSGGAALLLLGSRPLTTLLSSVQQNRISIIESRVQTPLWTITYGLWVLFSLKLKRVLGFMINFAQIVMLVLFISISIFFRMYKMNLFLDKGLYSQIKTPLHVSFF